MTDTPRTPTLPGSAVAGLFPTPAQPRSTRVGVEQELLAFDAATGAAVDIERVRRAVARTPLAGGIAFEPGGQVELNLPCAPGPLELDRCFRTTVSELRRRCADAGVRLDAAPVDPRPLDRVPLQLLSERYLAMQEHFDRISPAGRRMMRQTAGTQVCLDWWPGRAGFEQWRVLLLAGPFLAAALSRSAGPDSRLATWLAVDPDRTGFDDRLLNGEDPVAAYTAFAAGAARFVPIGQHLSTLFPPVRPRGRYLEVRFLDGQPDHLVGRIAGLLADLLYDDDRRRHVLALVAPKQHRLADLWHTAARTPDVIADLGHELLGDASVALAGAA
ncbi:MAG TPA: glutamate-cysteine ligase family protein [Nocardioides sp.]|nr:glutamate-cysteine ligase family protein [Nocardioides sp.]